MSYEFVESSVCGVWMDGIAASVDWYVGISTKCSCHFPLCDAATASKILPLPLPPHAPLQNKNLAS